MEIRGALKEDCKTVHRFVCELEDTQFDYAMFKEYYFRNIDNTDTIYRVAEDSGEAIGFLSCHGQYLLHHMDKVFEIQELYVDEANRNKKTGKMLIERLEGLLRQQGHKFLEVASSTKRKDAHRFYINNGFGQTHYRFTKTLD